MSGLVVLLVIVHFAASLLLAGFGVHRLSLAVRYLWLVKRQRRHRPRPLGRLPWVTVQIPLYNERYVATRAIRAAVALKYPRRRLEIQVLDDSTDETSGAIARVVAEFRQQGVDIRHLRRGHRKGFKAGALAAGLRVAKGELMAIFDADFIPSSDFLLQTVGEFSDPTVGLVQARWEHLNVETSVLTRAQAVQLDAHFTIEHGVRAGTDCFFNFNGTAGIWRKEAIQSAGGWHADTLTEDLDLSYRAQLHGWRFVYRDDIGVPSELPVEVAGYRLQQQRWAQGGVQTARKVLPAILRAPIHPRVKREALWHLAGHLSYPLILLLAAAGLCVSWLAGPVERSWVVTVDGTLLLFATASLSVFYGMAAWARAPEQLGRRLLMVPVIMILGAGIAIGQTTAVIRGLRGCRTPFRRTPKYQLRGRHGTSWRSAVYRIPATGAATIDCLLGVTVLTVGALQLISGGAAPTGMGVLVGAGLLSVGIAAFAQHHPRLSIIRRERRGRQVTRMLTAP